MRPLPRLHAITDRHVLGREDLGVRAAAIAAAGPAVALHVRDRAASARTLVAIVRRFQTLAAPPEAAVWVAGRPDLAAALGTHGVQLALADLPARDARRIFPHGWIGASVHSTDEANRAADEGADYLVTGNVYETATHPGRPAAGPALVERCAAGGLPVIAIGGVTAERARVLREAGAYGVAAVRELWDATDSAAAALALLAPWSDDG